MTTVINEDTCDGTLNKCKKECWLLLPITNYMFKLHKFVNYLVILRSVVRRKCPDNMVVVLPFLSKEGCRVISAS